MPAASDPSHPPDSSHPQNSSRLSGRPRPAARRAHQPLPEPLSYGAFRFQEARDAGIPRTRLRQADVTHPHHGLYVPGDGPRDVIDRCENLMPLLGPDCWFSHATAARLWGMPLPTKERDDESLHVLSAAGASRVRRPGVRGWESSSTRPPGTTLGVLPVVEPAAVWGQLALVGATEPSVTLTREWLVAVGDFLLTGPRRHGQRHPLCTRADLERAVGRRRGQRGAKALAWALDRVREPVDSPKETQLRLGLVRLGLREPDVQVPVLTAQGLRHADLGYPAAKLLIEYQGEEHRVSRTRWRQDLTRVQLFQDAGYRVVLVGADDVDCESDAAVSRLVDGKSQYGGEAPGASARGFGSDPGPGLRSLADRVRRALDGQTFGDA